MKLAGLSIIDNNNNPLFTKLANHTVIRTCLFFKLEINLLVIGDGSDSDHVHIASKHANGNCH